MLTAMLTCYLLIICDDVITLLSYFLTVQDAKERLLEAITSSLVFVCKLATYLFLVVKYWSVSKTIQLVIEDKPTTHVRVVELAIFYSVIALSVLL
jgi:hypothetical protein